MFVQDKWDMWTHYLGSQVCGERQNLCYQSVTKYSTNPDTIWCANQTLKYCWNSKLFSVTWLLFKRDNFVSVILFKGKQSHQLQKNKCACAHQKNPNQTNKEKENSCNDCIRRWLFMNQFTLNIVINRTVLCWPKSSWPSFKVTVAWHSQKVCDNWLWKLKEIWLQELWWIYLAWAIAPLVWFLLGFVFVVLT